MRFGIFAPQGWRLDLAEIADPVAQYEAMTNVARAADEGDWDSVWVYDHFHTVPTKQLETTFECWTATATLVRDTKRINVGQMVTCNGYRQPSLLAKIASTVDVASNGRLYCGFGAGWHQEEWKAYGYEWVETPVRMRKFREAVQIIHKMWTEDLPQFQGDYYQIDQPVNEPKGARKPHPSFWIGGSGEQVTLKLVAQYGNACNVNADPPEIARKLDVLRRHCENAGRDYDSIIKSHSVAISLQNADGSFGWPNRKYPRAEMAVESTIDDIRRKIEEVASVGIDYIIFYVDCVAYDTDKVHRLNEEIVRQYS